MGDQEQLRARSLKFLEEEDLRYQSMELPGGVITPGSDRSYLLPLIFGDDFKGGTYLDIGSYLGYFCIEALKRGAAQAVGVETDIANVRQSRRIAELWSLHPEYIHANFETWSSEGRQFDVVTCLNVLHHLIDPIHTLHRIMAMARKRVVLEIEVPTWRQALADRVGLSSLVGPNARAIAVGKPNKRGYSSALTYTFTPEALRIIFNNHTNLFEPVELSRSPFKGRLIAVAQKRQVGHLAVVVGPTSAGKSTLAKRLMEDPALRQRFGLEGEGWNLLQANQVARMPRGRHEKLIFHYDMLRPSRNGMRSHERDQTLDLLKVADKVTIITIAAPRARLIEQLRKGELQRPNQTQKALTRATALLEKYKTPQFLHDWYEGWEVFTRLYPNAKKYLAVNTGDFQPQPHENWRAALESAA